jgi:glycosyltransferase involved in cell wall biosynthesis
VAHEPGRLSVPRVLLVSHFFPPHGGGGVPRALSWTRWLPEFGWDVTVLAAGPGGFWIVDESQLARVPPATEVIRVDAPTAVALWRRHVAKASGVRAGGRDEWLKSIARLFLLPDSYRAWREPALAAGRERLARGGIDALVSTSPPETAHGVGLGLARETPSWSGPWIADFRDPWVGLHYRRPPTPWHRATHEAMERRVLRGADLVTCASRTHERALRDALGPAEASRVRFLPNGVDEEAVTAPGTAGAASPAVPAPAAPPGGPARVVFTGTLVEVPAMRAFLVALSRALAREPALRERLEVVIAGPFESAYDRLVSALGLAGVVRLLGPVPRDEARRLQRDAHVLLLVRNEGAGYAAMVPGKLYEYLAARRPIVALLGEGEAAELARSCGAAVVGPDEGDAAVARVLAVVQGRADAPRPDAPAIARLLEKRSRRVLAGELAGFLDEARRARREAR